jgi:hypothetical protein
MAVFPVSFQWKQAEDSRQYGVCHDKKFIDDQIHGIGFWFVNQSVNATN